MDTSGNLGPTNYHQQEPIVRKIVEKIASDVAKLSISLVSPNRGRVLFISYLNPFIQDGKDFLPKEMGPSLLKLPLDKVSTEVFMKPIWNVSKITIVFTAGFSSHPINHLSASVDALIQIRVPIFSSHLVH